MHEIKDFIGVFYNTLPSDECDRIIETYEKLKDENFCFSRKEFEKVHSTLKDGELTFLNDTYIKDENLLYLSKVHLKTFLETSWNCYSLYNEQYEVLSTLSRSMFYDDVKIQKFLPSQGYHAWHCEHDSRRNSSRVLLVLAYLNDVEEGGETEFLYQSRRIKPTKGTVIICPSGFTHTHRGNPPLSGVKYVMNGWIEFAE